VRGVIEHGRQLGRTIGMPTINLVPPEKKLLPPSGVYFSRAVIEGRSYSGVTNIGWKPTVDGSFLGVETYLYGTEENLYGKKAEIRLLKFRRPEMKFASVDELKAQMESDIRAGKEYFHI
jgi:riboflavin kinase/FMN adenylyltransferase